MTAPDLGSPRDVTSRRRFDVVFLSIDEPLADELFQRVQRILGRVAPGDLTPGRPQIPA